MLEFIPAELPSLHLHDRYFILNGGGIVSFYLSPLPVLEGSYYPAAVRIVFRISTGNKQYIKRESDVVSPYLYITFLHKVEKAYLQPFRQVGKLGHPASLTCQ